MTDPTGQTNSADPTYPDFPPFLLPHLLVDRFDRRLQAL